MANDVINHGYIVESPLETLNEGIRRGSRLVSGGSEGPVVRPYRDNGNSTPLPTCLATYISSFIIN